MLAPGAVLGEALALFRRDRAVLLGIAGPFLFLPLLLAGLMLPLPPQLPGGPGPLGDAQANAYAQSVSHWIGQAAPAGLLTLVITRFGLLAILLLYLDPARPTVQQALGRAVWLLPAFVLSILFTWLPVAAGLFVLILPGLYLLLRFSLIGAALVAGARRPGAAIGVSMALSRGRELGLLALFGGALVAQLVVAVLLGPLLALITTFGGAGAIGRIAGGAIESAIGAAWLLAVALIQVSAYRRLAGSISGT